MTITEDAWDMPAFEGDLRKFFVELRAVKNEISIGPRIVERAVQGAEKVDQVVARLPIASESFFAVAFDGTRKSILTAG